ncbi:hypothetical protein FQN57_004783 [Myotisia sp. PD_48]|nr:hypothetical protein FQN57_004783 [Myotisia sp. PD_48]
MSLAPISVPDRQPSPVTLGSNNPFRNRASTALLSPDIRPPRPLSTNPFLDNTQPPMSPQSNHSGEMSPRKNNAPEPELTGHTAELFENLNLDASSKPKPRRPPPRPENMPPGGYHGKPQQMRRPSKEGSGSRDRDRDRVNGRPSARPLIDVFADPEDAPKSNSSRRERRPRRNSDSSLMERPSRALDPEEERRRRRHKERASKHREGRSKRSNNQLDIIDKLDFTGIGGHPAFHHDGPFDACNPHRNRKGVRAAPMQAFPKDSRNMALGGSGPVNSKLDLNLFHGRGSEGYSDYAHAIKAEAGSGFDPSSRIEPIHGAESLGLGTSTFLEGTPASRAAIQRRQSETEAHGFTGGGGLQRGKSLAQKIRGINNRNYAARVTSPEPLLGSKRPGSSPGKKPNDNNPFFQQNYDDAYDQKGAKIQQASESLGAGSGRPRSVSSPKVAFGHEAKNSIEGNSSANEGIKSPNTGGGFMNRVKSLRRPRPEKKQQAVD